MADHDMNQRAHKDYVDCICQCGAKYQARTADLRRGWGKSCSKSCAALNRKSGKGRRRGVVRSSIEQDNEDARIAGMDTLDHDWSI